jgi:hypothetical protein
LEVRLGLIDVVAPPLLATMPISVLAAEAKPRSP